MLVAADMLVDDSTAHLTLLPVQIVVEKNARRLELELEEVPP